MLHGREPPGRMFAMSDIIDRIKGLRYIHVPQASQLFEEAVAEIERLRAEVNELRQHQCLWGNDPSGPYLPGAYIHGVAHAAAAACDVARANDATAGREGRK